MEVLLKSKELGNDKLFDQLISKIKKNWKIAACI